VSAGAAIVANVVLGGSFQVQEWLQQNIVVTPMLVIAVIATIFVHNRWVQFASGILILAAWAYLLSMLQGALS